MTITTTDTRIRYTGDGTTVTFIYDFPIYEDNDLVVLRHTATSTAETLILNTDYTVTGAGVVTGGTVVLSAGSVCPDGYYLTIIREIELTQEVDFVDGAAVDADTLETPLDKGCLIDQQLDEAIRRAPKFRKSLTLKDCDLPTPVANSLIGWDSLGTGFANFSTGTVSVPTIDHIGNYGDSLNTAITTIGSTPTLLLINKTIVLTAHAIVPSTLQLWIPTTGSITLGAYNISIGGSIEASRSKIFNYTGAGVVTGLAIAYPEWFGAKADNSTDSTAGIVAALAAAKVVQGTAGIYKHTGFTLYTDKSILGLGQGTTFFDYTPATGNAVTLAAVAPSTAHRRSRIKDVCLMSTGRSTGWGITTIPGEEQVDIEIGPIVVTDTDKGIWITYPSQGMMITPRLGGRGKTIVGSIGIKIGSTPNTALNMLLIAPYVSSYETAYEAYGYAITLQKPIWEACYTGVKVYGQVHVNHPSANATTDDIYVYANSGYGNLVAYGYVNTGGGANKITYETTAARDRSVVIPISHSSAHPMRIGPHEIGLQNISTNTKVRGNLGTANQTLADNTWTKIALNVETIDEMAEFSTVTGTATITTTGQYLVGGQIAFTTPGDGKRLNAAIYKNGAAICSSEALTGVASAYPTVSTQTFVLLTAADTIELYGRQVSGGAVDVTYGSTATYMYIMRIL